MSKRSRRTQGVLAGVGAFLVDIWPVLLIWRAGSSGSVGDLSDVTFLGLGIVYATLLGLFVGWQMTVALRLVASSPRSGKFDPWGAYALGVGTYCLAVTAVPAAMYGLLLADENRSLRDRMWLVALLWVGGHILAAVLAYLSSRVLLGRDLTADRGYDRSESVVA